ncbi:hypothetical protein LOC68_08755 [Blastopirellula sp. JC732]|uniref:Uncharacterized protein n=1 Tax=Blastopirellula sediminis TaxID=2894196 RepID=A0A9X1SFM3_9BACT|nr:hypothetical protein [Blastopirellula sediminis]MCC9608740.1 hypothetical protein [Blastopirellula sediminis]MCC9628483.1 hypothetical protein [Blastopirellula sediminis]
MPAQLFAFAAILSLLIAVSPAWAQEPKIKDPAIQAAWEKCLSDTANAKKSLQDQLQSKKETAVLRGDLELVDVVTKETAAFKETGALPTTVSTDRYVSALQRAIAGLENAYERVIKEMVRDGKVEEARAALEEIEQLKSSKAFQPEFAAAEVEIISGAEKFQTLANGGKALSDRKYVWIDVPQDFSLKRFARVAGDGKGAIVVKVTKPGYAYFALAEKAALQTPFIREGEWEPTGEKFAYSDRTRTVLYVFRRVVPVGQYEIPRLGFTGPTWLAP